MCIYIYTYIYYCCCCRFPQDSHWGARLQPPVRHLRRRGGPGKKSCGETASINGFHDFYGNYCGFNMIWTMNYYEHLWFYEGLCGFNMIWTMNHYEHLWFYEFLAEKNYESCDSCRMVDCVETCHLIRICQDMFGKLDHVRCKAILWTYIYQLYMTFVCQRVCGRDQHIYMCISVK